MTTFGDWLRQQLKKREWSQGELARRSGYRPGVVSTWVNDKRLPRERSLKDIARALELPEDEVFAAAGYEPEGADGSRLAREEALQMIQRVEQINRELRATLEAFVVTEVVAEGVPIVGYVPADSLRWAAAEDLGTVEVTPQEIAGTRRPYAVIVRGNCMRSVGILDGDIVILDDPAGRQPRDQQIVAVEIDGDVTLKRWCETPDGIELRDGDENVVHSLTGRENVRVLGLYVTFRPVAER